jgi:molecular chaperone GrpE
MGSEQDELKTPLPPAEQDGSAAKESPDQNESASDASSLDELAAARQERDDAVARLQRLAADFQNFQKRVSRQETEIRRFANDDLIKGFLQILDDFERSLDVAARSESVEQVVKGFQIVCDQFQQALKGFGVEPIECIGAPFDPMLHEALMQQEREGAEPGSVVEEIRRGYTFRERVIRPARVVVTPPDSSDLKRSDADVEPSSDNSDNSSHTDVDDGNLEK